MAPGSRVVALRLQRGQPVFAAVTSAARFVGLIFKGR